MRKFTLIVASLCFTIALTYGQQTFHTTPTSTIAYLEYLPKDYTLNSDKYPVVFFLHGMGEKGPNTTDISVLQDNIYIAAKNGPPHLVNSGTQFPFILITPHLKSNYGDWPSTYVTEVIDYCKTYLRIDERRIYLTGLSLGGGGTWWTAQDFPKRFAAIAPVCGSRNSTSKAGLLAAENLPVWAFHGDADGTVPLSRSVNMVAAINKCLPVPTPLAKMTIYPGVGHNAWDNAYKPDHTLHNPNVYEWMLSYTNVINGANKIPIANAGLDIVKALPIDKLIIQSSSTDADGSIASFAWTQLSGPNNATLASANTSALAISGLTEGVYTFRLQVTDNAGDMDVDYVRVTMTPILNKPNSGPVVSAGADRIIKLPTAGVTLFGSAYDTDGKIIAYRWAQVSGPVCSISSNSIVRPKVTNLKSGTYVFRLTAFDDSGVSNSDDVTYVLDVPPVVTAGVNLTVTLPVASLTLKGSATDSDGKIVSYLWSKYSGPSVIFANKTSPSTAASSLKAGTYVFRLEAKDDAGVAASSLVTVIVLPAIGGRESTEVVETASNEAKFALTDKTNPDLVNSTVIVYNQLGQKLYEDRWSEDIYSKVFTQNGLYIYHIINSKGRVTGKVYVDSN